MMRCDPLRGYTPLFVAKRLTLKEHFLLIDILSHNLEQWWGGIAMTDAPTLFYLQSYRSLLLYKT